MSRLPTGATDGEAANLIDRVHISELTSSPQAQQSPDEAGPRANGRPQPLEEEEFEEEDVSKREIELRRIYDELSKEDARCTA